MVEIPERFRDSTFRFVRIKSGGKNPIDKNWTKTANFAFNDSKLKEHEGNVGLLTGNGLIVFDCDVSEAEEIARELPETLVIGTSMDKGYRKKHFYFKCDIENKIILEDKNGKHFGEIQTTGQQCIIPPSIHPSGIEYEIIEDREIATINPEVLHRHLPLELIKDTKLKKKNTTENDPICAEIKDKIKMEGLLNYYNVDTSRNPTICPFGHESIRESCFSFNEDVYYCWHCGETGNIFHFVMKMDKCNFIQAKQKLAERLGIELKRTSLYFKDEKFVPRLLADDILKDLTIKTSEGDHTTYVYQKGVYLEGEDIIKKLCQEKLGLLSKQYYFTETIDLIHGSTFFNRAEQEVDVNLINIANGLIDIKTDLLKKHDTNIFFTTQIPVDYNPDADCPTFKKFINEVLPESDIPIIQELFGYCLYRKYNIQKAFMFMGDGCNGKSTLLYTLQKFLGQRNTASVSLQQLETNRFSSYQLYGKLANVYDDIPDKSMETTGNFKMLTGGSYIQAERKFKEPFQFVNYAKMIFSANKLPYSRDTTTAFFRRWIIINFPHTFKGKECDKKLAEKLTTKEELSGILTWSFIGLKRLLENEDFSNSKTTEEIQEQYQHMANPVQAFIDDCCIVGYNETVTKKQLYGYYVEYCQKNNLLVVSINTFSQRLRMLLPNLGEQQLGEKKERSWKGVKIRDSISNTINGNTINSQNICDVKTTIGHASPTSHANLHLREIRKKNNIMYRVKTGVTSVTGVTDSENVLSMSILTDFILDFLKTESTLVDLTEAAKKHFSITEQSSIDFTEKLIEVTDKMRSEGQLFEPTVGYFKTV